MEQQVTASAGCLIEKLQGKRAPTSQRGSKLRSLCPGCRVEKTPHAPLQHEVSNGKATHVD